MSKWEKWIINGEESLRLTGEALKEKISKIPEEKLCEPEPYVAVPAIQQIAYCYNSTELREMYANLLASSMNCDTKGVVHPGYVDIIKQLTPDEAKLLNILPRDSKTFMPLIDLNFQETGKRGKITLLRHYSNLCEKVCDFPQNNCSYLENLSRLELIRIQDDRNITVDSLYEPLEKSSVVQHIMLRKDLIGNGSFEFGRHLFYVTDFGLGFIDCCIIRK